MSFRILVFRKVDVSGKLVNLIAHRIRALFLSLAVFQWHGLRCSGEHSSQISGEVHWGSCLRIGRNRKEILWRLLGRISRATALNERGSLGAKGDPEWWRHPYFIYGSVLQYCIFCEKWKAGTALSQICFINGMIYTEGAGIKKSGFRDTFLAGVSVYNSTDQAGQLFKGLQNIWRLKSR
jgi:hypothetical protein